MARKFKAKVHCNFELQFQRGFFSFLFCNFLWTFFFSVFFKEFISSIFPYFFLYNFHLQNSIYVLFFSVAKNVGIFEKRPTIPTATTKSNLSINTVFENYRKVSFNLASYVFNLSRQKFIKNAKNRQLWRVFEYMMLAVKQSYQTGQ